MSAKTARPQQQSLRFSILEPVVCQRIEIQVELERVAGDARHPGGWTGHIHWRLGETTEDLLERLRPMLLELCSPQRVLTDNGSARRGRRKGADGDARG